MRILVVSLFVALACLHAEAAETVTMEAAIKLAEVFVAENGYTDLPESGVKHALDYERIEWTSARKELLQRRRNTLLPTAIGAKYGRKNGQAGWSVAFDYTDQSGISDTCRVVTMDSNGRDILMEHVAGIRKYFAGFEKSQRR